jgi:hypothetical protein
MVTGTTYEIESRVARYQAAGAPAAEDSFMNEGRGQRRLAQRTRATLSLRWRVTRDGLIGAWKRGRRSADEARLLKPCALPHHVATAHAVWRRRGNNYKHSKENWGEA